MGREVSAKCLDCGSTFTVEHGGGCRFHLVRCDKCGATKSIAFKDLGELHLRYVKGLPEPYCIASAKEDERIQADTTLEPLSEHDYHNGVEAYAGKCRCGGPFTLDAAPRCPQCHSTHIEEGETTIMYD